jgi:hypothetical protein
MILASSRAPCLTLTLMAAARFPQKHELLRLAAERSSAIPVTVAAAPAALAHSGCAHLQLQKKRSHTGTYPFYPWSRHRQLVVLVVLMVLRVWLLLLPPAAAAAQLR